MAIVQMKKWIVYFVVFLHLFFPLLADQNQVNLKAEILEMCRQDQDIRFQWLAARGTVAEEGLLERMSQIDIQHVEKLKKIVLLYGWPGWSLIGKEGSHAMWLLIQHTPDLEFQKHCLTLLEEAVANQEAAIIDLAYLKDRVLMYEGKKQVYGTQFQFQEIYPIEDEEHVDERRLAIGLCPLHEYIDLFHSL